MPFSDPETQAEIRRRAREGRIIFTDHGAEQARMRGIDELEITKCLKSGILVSADWDAEHQDYTYRMSRNPNSPSSITVVVALDDENDIVVTTF